MTVLCVASEPLHPGGRRGRGGSRDPTFEFLPSSVFDAADTVEVCRAGSSLPQLMRAFEGGDLRKTLSSHHVITGKPGFLPGVLLSLVKRLKNRVR